MSTIVRITFPYEVREVVSKWDRERYEAMRIKFSDILELSEWKEGSNTAPAWWNYGTKKMVTVEEDCAELTMEGIPFTVVAFKHMYHSKQKDMVTGNVTNVNIAIPNIGLLMIDEVTWLEDCCTENLQGHLNEGWRIIAVCPPNGDRRPTYIIGRAKKE